MEGCLLRMKCFLNLIQVKIHIVKIKGLKPIRFYCTTDEKQPASFEAGCFLYISSSLAIILRVPSFFFRYVSSIAFSVIADRIRDFIEFSYGFPLDSLIKLLLYLIRLMN